MSKRPGVCGNGGCERLATVEVYIFRVGQRALCYHCHQALSGLFGQLGPRKVAAPAPLSAA